MHYLMKPKILPPEWQASNAKCTLLSMEWCTFSKVWKASMGADLISPVVAFIYNRPGWARTSGFTCQFHSMYTISCTEPYNMYIIACPSVYTEQIHAKKFVYMWHKNKTIYWYQWQLIHSGTLFYMYICVLTHQCSNILADIPLWLQAGQSR